MTNVVLITGGFGYLGGRIAQQLAKTKGTTVRLATRRHDTSAPAWLPEAEVVTLALDNDPSIETACNGVHAVIHLAALDAKECGDDPQRALQVNGAGTLKLLQAAERAGVGKFIYFSTAHVYGAPLAGTLTEQSLPRPAHPYAITHHIAEDFVLAARDRGALEGIVVRMSNGFGAPAHTDISQWTLIVNDLCRQAITTRELVLRTSGLQLRDFVTLGDAARAAEHLLHLPTSHCADGVFNLGGACAYSMLALSERIAARCQSVLGFTPSIRRPAATPDEKVLPLDYRIDKLRQTGFELRGDIDFEIDATLKICKTAFQIDN